MDVLGGANQVELNLFRSQLDQERQVRALASGLRVQSASDDPSGLAISETIQTKVSGLQVGVQNVQNAGNVLTVVDSALATVQGILERIHTLIVEAHSDLNSAGQLQSIQTEIDKLLQEVNKIGSQTQFNGLRLLDGAFDNSAAQDPQAYVITSEPNADGTIAKTGVVNFDGLGNAGPLLPQAGTGPAGSSIPVLLSVHVTSYSSDPNTVDPDTGLTVGPSDILSIVTYSNNAGFGNGQQENDSSAMPVMAGEIPSPSAQLQSPNGAYITYQGGLANLTPQDVGTAETILTTAGKAAGTGSAMEVNSGGTEGATVSITLPTITTTTLGINAISVLDPAVVNFMNVVQGTGNNVYATDDAEARVSLAQQQISEARAQIGAQTVALNEDASDASLQIVNQIASESAIRDVDIGQATTAFMRDQVLSQIGTSVLAQMQADAQLVISLFARG